MSKLNLPDIGTLANASSSRQSINDNFTAIEDAINNTISRDGTTPNSMEADLDLNSNKVINVADPESDLDAVNKRSIQPLVNQYVTDIAQTIILGTAHVDRFVATEGQASFTLTATPGTSKNTFVTDTGLFLVPDVDYTLAGTDLRTLTFNTGRHAGAEIVARYMELAPPAGFNPADLDVALRGDLASVDPLKGAALVSAKLPDTGALPEKLFDAYKRTVSVEAFGAVGNGVTDDTAAIQAAINAVSARGGGVVQLAGKRYCINTQLLLPSYVTLRGAGIGATELIQTGNPDYVIKAIGSLGTPVYLTANAVAGDTTLQMSSTTGLAVDDYLVLCDNYQYNPLDMSYVSGEMVQILTKDSSIQVSLYTRVKGGMESSGNYLTLANANIRKITMVDSPAVEDLTITGDKESTSGLIAMKYCTQPRVSNVRLRHGGHYGLRLDTVREGYVDGLIVHDLMDVLADGHVGYAIVLAGANDGVTITNSQFTRVRHGVTTIGGPDGFSHRVTISNCMAVGTTAAGFDTHAAGDGILFTGCQTYGTIGQGIQVRSINTSVIGCLVSRSANHGITAGETLVRNMAVRDCVVEYAGNHGFTAESAVDGLMIAGCTFRAPGADGIRVSSLSTYVQILDNYVIGAGRTNSNRSGICSVANGSNAGRWLIARNFVRGDTGSHAYAIQTPNVNSSWVVDNKSFGTFSLGAYNLGTNTNLRNDALT